MSRIRGRNTFDSANSIYNVERLLSALSTPKTYAYLMAELHMTERSLCRYLAHLRATPNRQVRVKKYVLTNSRYCPLFALGSRPDAVMPKQTEKAKNRKWREKVKATPELQERLRRHEAARWAVKKAAKKPQSWLSALGAV